MILFANSSMADTAIGAVTVAAALYASWWITRLTARVTRWCMLGVANTTIRMLNPAAIQAQQATLQEVARLQGECSTLRDANAALQGFVDKAISPGAPRVPTETFEPVHPPRLVVPLPG